MIKLFIKSFCFTKGYVKNIRQYFILSSVLALINNQPTNQATKQPSNQATKQPGSQKTRNQAAN